MLMRRRRITPIKTLNKESASRKEITLLARHCGKGSPLAQYEQFGKVLLGGQRLLEQRKLFFKVAVHISDDPSCGY